MAKLIGLPRLSPTMEEGTLTRWAKQEGDDVAVDDLIAEVETDKASMEWRSFDRGVLLKQLVPEGTTLEPDAPVAILGERDEDIAELLKSAASPRSAVAVPAERGTVSPPTEEATATSEKTGDDATTQAADSEGTGRGQSTGPRKSIESEPQRAPETPADGNGDAEVSADDPGVVSGGHEESRTVSPEANAGSGDGDSARILASPSVRRLARESSIDLKKVSGSGPRGRIIQRDLERLSSSPREAEDRQATAPPVSERAGPEVVPLSATRRTIARRLAEAKATIPHYYLTLEIDAEPLQDARAELNRELENDADKISLNDLLIRACAATLRAHPEVNVSYMGDAIWKHQVVDIAVAVAVIDGLVTPVVRDADTKGVSTIAREVRELAALARDKKLKPEQMANATFTISNLGMYGIDDFSAVINPPQAAILAVGTLREEAVVRQGAVVPGRRMCLTLSCDHRAIDGAVGAEWLKALREILEHPIRMLR